MLYVFFLHWCENLVYYNIEAYKQEQSHHMDLSQFGADSFRFLFLINSKKEMPIPEVKKKCQEISANLVRPNHVTEISETAGSRKNLPEVNAPSTPQIIPAKADDNDFMDLKEEDFCGGEVVIASASQSKPDHSYFRNKILDQYPNLFKEGSNENFDYYGITEKTSCPLCELGHNDEKIEGRYKAGFYFIKCEQCEIEITA